MSCRSRSRWSRRLACACALLFVAGAASPAAASPETIKRATSNLLFGPVDFVLGPVVGTRSVYRNLQDIDDSTGVRAFYAIPGVAWNSAMCMGGGVLRMLSGIIEFVPGLLLIPFEADMDPIFAPAERSDALVWEEPDLMTVKFGINYVQ